MCVSFSAQHISNPAASQIYLHSLCCSACPLSFTHQIASSQGSLSEQVMWLFWAPSFMSSYQSKLASSSALVIKQRKKASENTEWAFFPLICQMLGTIYQSFAGKETVMSGWRNYFSFQTFSIWISLLPTTDLICLFMSESAHLYCRPIKNRKAIFLNIQYTHLPASNC